MNTISLFFGIRIMMDFSSNKPVFRAEYAGDSAQINIVDGTIISGFLPERQLKLVLAWNKLHRDELIMSLKSSDRDWDLDSLESCELDFTKFFPTVLQVFPTDDYKIYTYFNDGSVRLFDVMPLLKMVRFLNLLGI